MDKSVVPITPEMRERATAISAAVEAIGILEAQGKMMSAEKREGMTAVIEDAKRDLQLRHHRRWWLAYLTIGLAWFIFLAGAELSVHSLWVHLITLGVGLVIALGLVASAYFVRDAWDEEYVRRMRVHGEKCKCTNCDSGFERNLRLQTISSVTNAMERQLTPLVQASKQGKWDAHVEQWTYQELLDALQVWREKERQSVYTTFG